MLYGFSAAQLAASGSPAPAHAFRLRPDPAQLFAPAFAPNGDLWIAGQDPNTGASFLLHLTSGQLASANGALVPQDSLWHGQGLDPSVDPVRALVFDTAGNLWISGDAGYIAMFGQASLPGSRGDATDVAPTVRLPASLSAAAALAFDDRGNLWDVSAPVVTDPLIRVIRYPAAAIEPGGAGLPDVTDSLDATYAGSPLTNITGLAFAPRNGERLAQHLRHQPASLSNRHR